VFFRAPVPGSMIVDIWQPDTPNAIDTRRFLTSNLIGRFQPVGLGRHIVVLTTPPERDRCTHPAGWMGECNPGKP
jgi:hypothetical protein